MARINKRTPTGRWGKDKEYSASVNSGSYRIENGKALPELRSVTLTLAADDEKELYVTLTRQELSEAWEFLQKCEREREAEADTRPCTQDEGEIRAERPFLAIEKMKR